jgi:hypothetical protein
MKLEDLQLARKPRNYKKEYSEYHKKPLQKKRRADRNAARRKAVKRVGKAALKGKEVDHVGSHRLGRLRKVPTRIISKKANRRRQPKRS